VSPISLYGIYFITGRTCVLPLMLVGAGRLMCLAMVFNA